MHCSSNSCALREIAIDPELGARRLPSKRSPPDDGDGAADRVGVLRCPSNAPRRRSSSFLTRAKTRSRLMDSPPPAPRPSDVARSPPRSGQLRPGLLGRPAPGEEEKDEEEDPFLDEDRAPAQGRSKCSKFRPWQVLQWTSLVLILASLAVVLTFPVLRRRSFWGFPLWRWLVLLLVLVCGRLVSGWVVRLIVFSVERSFLLSNCWLYFIYGVRKSVQTSIWFSLVVLAWNVLFDQKVGSKDQTQAKALAYCNKILICLIAGIVLRLIKTVLVKYFASSFHVSTYFDRIQEAIFNQYVIETLSGTRLFDQAEEEQSSPSSEMQKLQGAGAGGASAAAPSYAREFTLRDGLQNGNGNGFPKEATARRQEGIKMEKLHRLNQKNVSASRMKRLMKVVRQRKLSTLDEQLVNANGQDESNEIGSEQEAKAAAKKIFYNVVKPDARYIELADLMCFMKEDEAIKTISMFEGEEDRRVTKKSLKNWVVNAFRERRALALTLNDTKTAVDKLNQLANIVVGIAVVVISLLVLGFTTTKDLVFLSSQLLLVTFVFGNTLKTIFEAMIFLFVMHPFDVGDRCEIGGVQLVVEEMNILTTTFLRFDNQKITYPNSVLSTLPIGNYYRSPDMGDSIDFCVHVSTPTEKLSLLKERVKEFIETKEDHWHPNPTVVIKDVDEMNKVKVSIYMRHRMNFQEMNERWNRRDHVVRALINILRDLNIEYRMLPVDVNLRALPAETSQRPQSTWSAIY